MHAPCSRLTCFCLTALFALAAATRAGEELMPLAPGNPPDSLAGTDDVSERRQDADAQTRPAVKVNVVKLTLPALAKPNAAAKVRHVEAPPQKTEGAGMAPSLPRLTATGPSPLTRPSRGIVSQAPATFSPIDHIEDIPGMVTPDVIATGVPARGVTVTTYSAGRDDLLDLVPEIAAAAPQSLSISPALPSMPSRRDGRISTLEPFAFEPAPRKPRPELIHLPPPIASEQGYDFPGFAERSPAEGITAARVPAHPAVAPAPHPVAAGSQSLRPPPNFGKKPEPTAVAAPLARKPSGSSLLSAPLGLSLTATMPMSRYPAPASGRVRQTAVRNVSRQPAYVAPAPPPPQPRQAPSLGERTVPEADPDDEYGFTMMRGVKNLLGQ